MTVIQKTQALRIIGRAYGTTYADSVAPHLPDRIDLDSAADRARLHRSAGAFGARVH